MVGDHLSRGTKFLGTICPGGLNLMGTICTRGSILCRLFVQEDRKLGIGSPGINWVQDQMRPSLTVYTVNVVTLI